MGIERNTRLRASQIVSILPDDLEATNSLVDNYVPKYNSATGKFTWVAVAGGVSVLDDLTDVSFASGTPTDNQVLTYDSVTSKWKAEDSAGGSSTSIVDADNDTKIQVEKNSDEDIIRFDIAGVEQIILQDGALIPTTDNDVSIGDATHRVKELYLMPTSLYLGTKHLTKVFIEKIEDNIMVNAFRIAINGSLTQFNMTDGIVDEYEDESGIDNPTSTNESYDSVNDLYSPTSPSSTNQIPTMTSNTAPSGTASASTFYNSNYVPYKAMDGSDGTSWATASGTVIGWLAYEFTSSKVIIKYSIKNTSEPVSSMPKDWTFEGWTGSEWDVLDTITGETGWSSLELRNFIFSNVTSYIKYRVNVSANDGHGGYLGIGRLEMMISSIPDNMTLQSESFTAQATPSSARIVLLEEDVDSVTLNTDLKAYVSRDGGSTFAQVTLTDEGNYDASKQILAGTVDLTQSGIGSGTSMKYKITTLNTKNLKIHATGLSWN